MWPIDMHKYCTLRMQSVQLRTQGTVGKVVGVWPIDMQTPPPPIHNSTVSYTILCCDSEAVHFFLIYNRGFKDVITTLHSSHTWLIGFV